jgi:type I restriction enzyme S subunit
VSDLPEGWEWESIGEVTEPIVKHNPRDTPEVEFDYIDISSIEAYKIVWPKRITGRDAPSRARQLVREGDTVLSTVRTYLKNTALVPPALDGATASTGFSVLRPQAGRIASRFLFYRVVENEFVEKLTAKQTGTSYPAVRDSDIRGMRILIPPLPVQGRIVDVIEEQFSRLDAGVESLNRAVSLAKVFRQTVLTNAFQNLPLGTPVDT